MDLSLSLLIMGLESIGLYMFLNFFNCMMIVLILSSFMALMYIDGCYVLLILMVWPIVMYLYMMLSSMLNSVKINLVMKVFYMKLLSVLVSSLMLMYVLSLMLYSVVLLYIVGGYVSYWLICVNVVMLGILGYLMIEIKLMWLGVLPFVLFFMKQNLMMGFFMLKVMWMY